MPPPVIFPNGKALEDMAADQLVPYTTELLNSLKRGFGLAEYLTEEAATGMAVLTFLLLAAIIMLIAILSILEAANEHTNHPDIVIMKKQAQTASPDILLVEDPEAIYDSDVGSDFSSLSTQSVSGASDATSPHSLMSSKNKERNKNNRKKKHSKHNPMDDDKYGDIPKELKEWIHSVLKAKLPPSSESYSPKALSTSCSSVHSIDVDKLVPESYDQFENIDLESQPQSPLLAPDKERHQRHIDLKRFMASLIYGNGMGKESNLAVR